MLTSQQSNLFIIFLTNRNIFYFLYSYLTVIYSIYDMLTSQKSNLLIIFLTNRNILYLLYVKHSYETANILTFFTYALVSRSINLITFWCFNFRVPVQTSDGTNIRLTNVGRYKRRTRQTSDQYKRRTSTNVGLVQTSDQYKRRTW